MSRTAAVRSGSGTAHSPRRRQVCQRFEVEAGPSPPPTAQAMPIRLKPPRPHAVMAGPGVPGRA
ncbi:MAG: hypothetical protein JWL58_7359 [Streptosporangiaceae bacterium]|jgi:hypothetical protein|nr:hypothetical protein [Streptosporangiaceae bacterium]